MIIDEPEAQVIYLAGIIDGEGHITRAYTSSHKNGKTYKSLNSRIMIANTNLELMEWIIDNFGGTYSKSKKAKEHYKQCYSWILSGKNAEELAKRLKPYLIVKKDQVERLLNLETLVS